MFRFDLSRKYSKCQAHMAQWLEAADMWVVLLDALLAHLERRPTLTDEPQVVTALLANLYQLLNDADAVLQLPYDLTLRYVLSSLSWSIADSTL